MATASGSYLCDNSSLANFKNWAAPIGAALASFGWIQSNDTGQVVWTATVLTLTQITVSGATAIYAYSSYTGPAPRVGMSVIITGFVTSANNVTATLTAVSGGASGTVTVTKVSQVNETHAGSGTTTALAAVPSSAYVNEIWYANDAQAATLPIYLKIGYGFSATNVGVQLTVGTGSNGTGTITNILSGFSAFSPTLAVNQGATTFPCYFSGDAGEFRMVLWVTKNTNDQFVFVVERSKDTSGAKTADYFTVIELVASTAHQQTCTGVSTTVTFETWPVAVACGSTNRGTAFLGSTVAAFPFFPLLGALGNPMLGIMACIAADVADNSIVTVASMYGSTHTFVVTKGGTGVAIRGAAQALNFGNPNAILVRYE